MEMRNCNQILFRGLFRELFREALPGALPESLPKTLPGTLPGALPGVPPGAPPGAPPPQEMLPGAPPGDGAGHGLPPNPRVREQSLGTIGAKTYWKRKKTATPMGANSNLEKICQDGGTG